MIQQVWTIARSTFIEAIRQPIFLIILVIGLLALILNPALSSYAFEENDKLMIDLGLSTILLCGLVLSAFSSAGVLSREIENKTILTVISKPVARPLFVVGKFLGVAAAISLALWIWAVTFLLIVRHGVLFGAGDTYDMVVVTFALIALALALFISLWGNYFYGWVFTSTFTTIFAITLTLAYFFVLLISKKWQFQPLLTEFAKENGSLIQIIMAIFLVMQAVWILTSVAVALSTRLGQVMTLLICIGVFLLGVIGERMFSDLSNSTHAPLRYTGYILQPAVPNLHIFFMSDALTQNNPFTPYYCLLATGYCALFIAAMLFLAMALFQTRESG